MNTSKYRVENEKHHAKYLVENDAEDVWNWSSPAGRRRAERRGELIAKELTGCCEVLEIGCGTGLFSKMLGTLLPNSHFVSTELTEDLLEIAKNKNTAVNVEYRTADAHHFDFDDESFDAVWGSSVLHHLDVDRALLEMKRVLKPGGKIVFAEPNLINPQIWAERNIDFVRRRVGASPDETAFIRFTLKWKLKQLDFIEINIMPHEFLHPSIPRSLVPFVEKLTLLLEKVPLVREIGGSLLICCQKKKSL